MPSLFDDFSTCELLPPEANVYRFTVLGRLRKKHPIAKINRPERVRKHSPALTNHANKEHEMADIQPTNAHAAPQPLPTDKRFKDLTGRRFGRLLVKYYLGRQGHRNSIWMAVCDCGDQRIVRTGHLLNGSTQSCGCLNDELASTRFSTHGMSDSEEYSTWQQMINRCENKNATGYKNYGGRNIKVCQRWRDSFEAFYADLGSKPTPEHSIERKDNNGDYEPSNCEWATKTSQARNRRTTYLIQHNGESLSAAEWSERTGIPSYLIIQRMERDGWTAARALKTPTKTIR